MKQVVKVDLGGQLIEVETGHMAKQAHGSVLVKSGNSVVLVTVVSSKKDSDMDFFPLTVEYSEKFYSSGRIPGGFFKREGRPTAEATLNARLIDRPLRPTFPKGYNRDTQIVATILSYDGSYPVEILASLGASAATHISDIPFNGPTAAVKVGHVDGNFVVNPGLEELKKSKLDLIVSGTSQGILMVEGEASLVKESLVLEALKFAYEQIQPLLKCQDQLREQTGSQPKREFVPYQVEDSFKAKVVEFARPRLEQALGTSEKILRYSLYESIEKEGQALFVDSVKDEVEKEVFKKNLSIVLSDLKYEMARSSILSKSSRMDGRSLTQVRPISCQVGLLPRTHGSALFTRGETQVLGTVTLGTGDDEQNIDSLGGFYKKKFMLHYNFPPYCVGETGRLGGQSRREIGHGNLAERAVKAVLPEHSQFPYTVRLVGEVLESNGSSSMGTVCSSSLALLDAGVPIEGAVSGVAMGLISEGGQTAILTDILGDEDHLGDMDFKVAGTREGVSAIQMDIKIDSIGFDVIEKALDQARQGRLHILDEMEKVIQKPRGEISQFAPRIETIKIKPEKVREVIGAGGKVIKALVEETGVKIDIEDDGTIRIASTNPEMTQKAISMIEDICAEAQLGQAYSGKVVKVVEFGAFVEILPNAQGLLHISEISRDRVRNVGDHLKEGQSVRVKVIDIDRSGRIKLSRKALLSENES